MNASEYQKASMLALGSHKMGFEVRLGSKINLENKLLDIRYSFVTVEEALAFIHGWEEYDKYCSVREKQPEEKKVVKKKPAKKK